MNVKRHKYKKYVYFTLGLSHPGSKRRELTKAAKRKHRKETKRRRRQAR